MVNERLKRGFLSVPYVLWLLFFIFFPIALLLVQALTDSAGHITATNFIDYLSSGVYLRMTFNSVLFSLLITALTIVIGYPTAYLISRTKQKNFWLLVVILPTWINLLLKTYAFIGLLSKQGTINELLGVFNIAPQQLLFSDWSFVLVASYIELPFMILPIFNALIQINPNLIQASEDLGATRWQTIKNIIFPLSLNGLKAGFQAVFIPSLSLFMITRIIGGNRVITLGTVIEEHFLVTQNWHMGATIGIILVIAMIITMSLTRNRGEKKS